MRARACVRACVRMCVCCNHRVGCNTDTKSTRGLKAIRKIPQQRDKLFYPNSRMQALHILHLSKNKSSKMGSRSSLHFHTWEKLAKSHNNDNKRTNVKWNGPAILYTTSKWVTIYGRLELVGHWTLEWMVSSRYSYFPL